MYDLYQLQTAFIVINFELYGNEIRYLGLIDNYAIGTICNSSKVVVLVVISNWSMMDIIITFLFPFVVTIASSEFFKIYPFWAQMFFQLRRISLKRPSHEESCWRDVTPR